MKINDILNEMGVGGVASVAMPMGATIRRAPGSPPKRKKKKATESDYEECSVCNGSGIDKAENACKACDGTGHKLPVDEAYDKSGKWIGNDNDSGIGPVRNRQKWNTPSGRDERPGADDELPTRYPTKPEPVRNVAIIIDGNVEKVWMSIYLPQAKAAAKKLRSQGKNVSLRWTSEPVNEGKEKKIPSANPVAKHMGTFNKASTQRDRKKDAKRGFTKHKGNMDEAKKQNFTGDDLNRLSRIRDLGAMKEKAMELISSDSAHPMKPEKIEWFRNSMDRMVSTDQVIKLMYDLLLSGEGHGVVGSKGSMGRNSYRKAFDEADEAKKKAGIPDSTSRGQEKAAKRNTSKKRRQADNKATDIEEAKVKKVPHAKASTPAPKGKKPPKKGNTSPHPLRGKLVGGGM